MDKGEFRKILMDCMEETKEIPLQNAIQSILNYDQKFDNIYLYSNFKSIDVDSIETLTIYFHKAFYFEVSYFNPIDYPHRGDKVYYCNLMLHYNNKDLLIESFSDTNMNDRCFEIFLYQCLENMGLNLEEK